MNFKNLQGLAQTPGATDVEGTLAVIWLNILIW